MDIKRQERAPIYEALEEFKKKRVVPFDVPGHKRGRGNPELVHLLGEKCVGLDVGKCLSYGRRHHLCGAGHDFVHLQGRRQDYTSEKCS